METEFLDLEDLLRLTHQLGAGPVRDLGLLDSAAARPKTTLFGEDAYPELAEKASALLDSICNNHPLVDGNKRLAWFATVVFLGLNGFEVEMSDDDAFDLVLGVAAGDVDLGSLTARLSASLRRTP